MEILKENKNFVFKVLTVSILVFIFVCTMGRFGRMHHGGFSTNQTENTISVSGHGEVFATADIANLYFTIRKEGKTVKEAEDMVAQMEAKVLAFLKEKNIADKDIKAENVSFYPKYNYNNPCINTGIRPCDSNPKIVGYESSESISVKIREIDSAGEIVAGLGAIGITELNGPNFAIDDEDALKADARAQAIVDAKNKAERLAKDLGVHLGDITTFSENGNYPMPMMYGKSAMMDSAVEAVAPTLPKGENKVSSDVTITYRIR